MEGVPIAGTHNLLVFGLRTASEGKCIIRILSRSTLGASIIVEDQIHEGRITVEILSMGVIQVTVGNDVLNGRKFRDCVIHEIIMARSRWHILLGHRKGHLNGR